MDNGIIVLRKLRDYNLHALEQAKYRLATHPEGTTGHTHNKAIIYAAEIVLFDIKLECETHNVDLEYVFLTPMEEVMLQKVFNGWHEDEGGYSEFTSDNVTSGGVSGIVIKSLINKGLVYDSYDTSDDELEMYCMTQEGVELYMELNKTG